MTEQHHLPLTPAQEAERYLENARRILTEKAGKKDGLYADVKYVKWLLARPTRLLCLFWMNI